MSWASKAELYLLPVIFTSAAFGFRVQFDGSGATSEIQSEVLRTNSVANPVEVRFKMSGIDVENTSEGFQEVKVSDLVPLDEVGSPDVLGTGTLITVPNGFEPELEIVDQNVRSIPNIVIKPAQAKSRCGGSMTPFAFNSNLYRSRGLYPESNISLEEVGHLQGAHLVRVGVRPIQVNFADRSTRVTSSLTIRVHFRSKGRTGAIRISKSMAEILALTTVNGLDLLNTTLRASNDRMLIVAADSLMDTVAPLADWKRSRGMDVKVVKFSEAGGNKDAVKQFIQKEYDNTATRPTFLVFVGNKDTMPGHTESTSAGSAATDRPYALLSGNDEIPDAFYGRVVADNSDEATTQIGRWIQYEKTPENGASWYTQGTTIASSEGSNPSDKEYAQKIEAALKAYTYTDVDGFYQSDKTATSSNIKSALVGGRSWIAYFGHGSGTSWGSTNDTFSNATVDTLTNGNRLPIVIDVACLNASWVKMARPFGKAWVTRKSQGAHAGAVAFYGGSVSISWHPPAVMSVGIAKYHFEKPVQTLGASVLAGQLYLIEKMGNTNQTIDNLKWYNLFGDPSLLIRTATPKSYTVHHDIKTRKGRTNVTVSAVDSSGSPIAGVAASLATDKELVASGVTNSMGKAELTLPGIGELEAGTVLTTTGYNLESYQTEIQ